MPPFSQRDTVDPISGTVQAVSNLQFQRRQVVGTGTDQNQLCFTADAVGRTGAGVAG